jgi:predicted permease
MLDVLNLALPFFGLIFIGFACGKWRRLPDEGLAWMNFFILYVALPALFFRILSRTPFEQLAQVTSSRRPARHRRRLRPRVPDRPFAPG